MTELLQRPVNATLLWWPSVLRVGLWSYIGMATSMLAALHALTPETQATAHLTPALVWWLKTFCEVTNAGALAIRLYLDDSHAKHGEKINGNGAADHSSVPVRTSVGG